MTKTILDDLNVASNSITADEIGSEAATAGYLLTADGAGGSTFSALTAGSGGLLASGATVGATAQAQIFTTGVGVGASPPAAMLGVIGADSLNTSFASNISGATGTGLVVTNAGNVGIGTTGPSKQLHITGEALIEVGAGTGEGLSITKTGTADIMLTAEGGQRIYSKAYENIWQWHTGAEIMRLTGTGLGIGYTDNGTAKLAINGNVGIGTTAPTAALHLPASSTARASLCIPAGTAPTIPVEGDVWTASGKMYIYIGAVTKEIAFV